ncbi:hypothetical protein acdb102_07030 [Acidothermaceae bacterium B102]|nr:hypothetical protein acdb102_07030 [Acidothermaceae bacterium B102]
MAIATAAPAPAGDRPGRRWLRLAPLLVVVLVVGLAARWFTDDQALGRYNSIVTTTTSPGRAMYLDAGV